jgi:hypothetical protein
LKPSSLLFILVANSYNVTLHWAAGLGGSTTTDAVASDRLGSALCQR